MKLPLWFKVLFGYFILIAVIGFTVFILVYEFRRLHDIEKANGGLHKLQREIYAIYHHVTELAIQGESFIGWEEKNYRLYQDKRIYTDSLLQTIRPSLAEYINPEHIDTLRQLLTDKEMNLRHLMKVIERQSKADSIIVSQLPEIAKRATRICTIKQKKTDSLEHWVAKRKFKYCLSPRNCMLSVIV